MTLGLHELALFSFTVLVLNATPGVDMLYTVSRTLQGGWRSGLSASAGITLGCLVHIVLAASGLAALLAVASWAFQLITWAGAAYLLWLAWGMLRSAIWPGAATPATPSEGDETSPADISHADHRASTSTTGFVAQQGWRDLRRTFRQGLITNVLNPKVALFVLAFLPQFIDADAPHKTLAFLALGGLMVAQGAVFLTALVGITRLLQRQVSTQRPTISGQLTRWLNAGGGLLFIALAIRIVLTDAPGSTPTSFERTSP